MIHKQFLSRDGNATILPPLHCHRQKSIARVSVALGITQNSMKMVLHRRMGGKIRGGVDKNFRIVDGNFPTYGHGL
jgi:hypothetical protein